MDTMLSSAGVYQVSALIGDMPLEDCGIAPSGAQIRPYFVNSVAGDPDLARLLVYLEDPYGFAVGEKVYYTLGAKPSAGEPEEGDDPAGPAWERIVYVSRFDGELPPLGFPEGLPAGRYVLVFEVLGLRETLRRVEKPLFFLDGAEFALEDISWYRPGGDGSSILPPGVTVMLEARINADPRLDPWLVWYNGKQKISEGSVSGGFSRILWEVPEQTGFQTLRAELFPQGPRAEEARLPGFVKELSLPVSAKYGRGRTEAESPLLRYALEGNLSGYAASGHAEDLRAAGEQQDIWLPWGRIYGLGLGREQVYALPSPLFEPPETGGVLRLSLVFAPQGDGTVFHGSFALAGNPAAAELVLELVNADGALVLNWAAGPERGSRTEIVPNLAGRETVSASIVFVAGEDFFIPGLRLSGQPEGAFLERELTPVAGTLTGGGAFYLGGGSGEAPPQAPAAEEDPEVSGPAILPAAPPEEDPPPAFQARTVPLAGNGGPAFILDEFSLYFSPASGEELLSLIAPEPLPPPEEAEEAPVIGAL